MMMSHTPGYTFDRAAMHRNASRGRIVSGLVLVGLGLAFSLGLAPIGYLGGTQRTFSALGHLGPWMIPGFALFFIGIGLLVAARLGGGDLLTWGLGLAGFGFGTSLGLWPIGFLASVERDFDTAVHICPWMLGGFIPLFIGLALTLADLMLRPQHAPPASKLPAESSAHRITGTSPLATPAVEG